MSNETATRRAVQEEVKRLIVFYESCGWDWGDAAAFTLAKGLGYWPPVKEPPRNRGGRPRKLADDT